MTASVDPFKLEVIRHALSAIAEEMSLVEVVVPPGARIEARTALSLKLLYRHDVTLLGVSRVTR